MRVRELIRQLSLSLLMQATSIEMIREKRKMKAMNIIFTFFAGFFRSLVGKCPRNSYETLNKSHESFDNNWYFSRFDWAIFITFITHIIFFALCLSNSWVFFSSYGNKIYAKTSIYF